MTDITKCRGDGCPIKDNCYRYTAPSSEMQSYFIEIPFEIKDEIFECNMFWGENAEEIFKQLKNIVEE